MSQDNTEGNAVAERIRAAEISINGSSSIEAMLANSLKEQKPLADDGKLHDSVQAAENSASSFVFVPPGRFSENVTVDTAGLTLLGSGRATLIEGGSSGVAITISNSNISISDLSVSTTGDGSKGGNSAIDTNTGADSINVENVVVRDSDDRGIRLRNGNEHVVKDCTVEKTDNDAIRFGVVRCIARGNIVESSGDHGIAVASHDCIAADNVVENASADGIFIDSDCIAIGNRVHNSGDNGIQMINGNDGIIANNRISGSTNADINDNGTGTILDSNLAGAAN